MKEAPPESGSFMNSFKANIGRIADAIERLLSLHLELGSVEGKDLFFKGLMLLASALAVTTITTIAIGLFVTAVCLFILELFPTISLWAITGTAAILLLLVVGIFAFSVYRGFSTGFELFPKTRSAMQGGWRWLMHEVRTTDVMH